MNDLDFLLKRVICQARAVKIPVSDNIYPIVTVNRTAEKRFGRCINTDGEYIIELSERMKNAPEKACCQIIAHEVIHTCRGCGNHGRLFKAYADKMNKAYDYNIKTTNTCEELGVEDISTVRYIISCRSCGAEIKRSRYSRLVSKPSLYRCKCGGVLKRTL